MNVLLFADLMRLFNTVSVQFFHVFAHAHQGGGLHGLRGWVRSDVNNALWVHALGLVELDDLLNESNNH